MSRSNNTELINPCKIYFEWQGSTGKLKHFDKTIGEKGENVITELPFTFLVLDKLSTIKGYSDSDQSGFWSNEVRNTKTETFTVRTKKGTITTDLYANLAPVLNLGACYCQSVYIAYYDANKELCIGNIGMQGSAIGAWIEFCKGKDIYKNAITIDGAVSAKKGATNYFIPTFKLNTITPETDAKALLLDKELQKYLTAYFNRNKEPENVLTQSQQQGIEELEPVDSFTSSDDLPDLNNDLPF